MCSLVVTKGIILASVIGAISIGIRKSGLLKPSYPIVKTLNGPVRGIISNSRDGRPYYEFLGIPYARAPINELRFEPPLPAKRWKEVLDANKFAPHCYQYDAILKGRFMGDEDCLYLNVYTPDVNGSLNVMVWIHGGGFLSGGASMYDAIYFMDSMNDVVVVSMNYRLGPFGFLNTGDNLVRGNMRLKDQRHALQVDPTKYQIFRWRSKQSHDFWRIGRRGIGFMMKQVHYHLLSPSSNGLYQKAILMSGAVTIPWSYKPDIRSQVLRFGKEVNCPVVNNTALVSCLRQLSPRALVLPMVNLMREMPLSQPGSIIVPSIEADVQDDTFLSENPLTLIQQGKFARVPLMFGINAGEGGLSTSRLEINEMFMKSVDEKWNDFCPLLLYYDPKKIDVSEKIREFYFGKADFSKNQKRFLKKINQVLSDGIFNHLIHNTASIHAEKGPVYMYYYNYTATLPSIYSLMTAVKPDDIIPVELKLVYSIAKDMFKKYLGYPGPHEYGPSHGDDLFQLWKMEWPFQIEESSSDYQFSRKFVRALVDFAKDEKTLPFNGVSWPPIEPNSPLPFKYMQIDVAGKLIDEPFAYKLPFWDSLNIRNPGETHNW